MRKYESGTGFCIWRWTITPYLTRLHLLKTPWFAVMLHWFHREDPYPHSHDHPVNFLSICLRGAYLERVGKDLLSIRRRCHSVGQVRLIRASHVHRILAVVPGTVTLCFNGPPVQAWGHFVQGEKIEWREYQKRFPLVETKK